MVNDSEIVMQNDRLKKKYPTTPWPNSINRGMKYPKVKLSKFVRNKGSSFLG